MPPARISPAVARAARVLALAILFPLLGGCAAQYFRDAGAPPEIPVRHAATALPFQEYWTGIVFNGEKIGFSRFSIAKGDETGRIDVRSEASFVLRFLGIEKTVRLKSHDVVADDLSLVRFAYDYHIDGSDLRVTGRLEPGALVATIVTGGKPASQRLPVKGRLYPSSVIALLPVVQGLAVGREYRYAVYNGETQAIADVAQRVTAYESSEVFAGNAFKVETTMSGQNVTTWIGLDGRPVFELALHGVMINALEDPGSARRYLALASLNKKESLIEYSVVRPDRAIDNPRAVSLLRVALSGRDRLPPAGPNQRCRRQEGEIACEIRAGPAGADAAGEAEARLGANYLEPSITVQSHDPNIRRVAGEIVAGADTDAERIRRLLHWMEVNIEKAPLDVFSALDVLERRRAECQGHAYLYAALARAAGIPTRVVNGIVYSPDFGGFLYHSWAESLDGATWRAVDPTFGQAAADATHLMLVEGESLADLIPLLDWVGQLKVRVLDVEHQLP